MGSGRWLVAGETDMPSAFVIGRYPYGRWICAGWVPAMAGSGPLRNPPYVSRRSGFRVAVGLCLVFRHTAYGGPHESLSAVAPASNPGREPHRGMMVPTWLHALMAKLGPAGWPRKLTADAAAASPRGLRPKAPLTRTLRGLAKDLVAEVQRLDRRGSTVTEQISAAVAESSTSFTELPRRWRPVGCEGAPPAPGGPALHRRGPHIVAVGTALVW